MLDVSGISMSRISVITLIIVACCVILYAPGPRYMAKVISDLQQVHRPGGWHDVECHLIMTGLVMSDDFERTRIKLADPSSAFKCSSQILQM
ncbi:hypothetical protein BDR03DRAFT_971070 [Suillus americanus]|nr:hypothetical protein BDR03DRAFT_971070 [Suillus americanus]